MDWDNVISIETLLTDFGQAERILEREGQVIIIAGNAPRYVLTAFDRDKPPASSAGSGVPELLNTVGKRIFVRYFREFRAHEDPLVFMAREPYTDGSKRSRASTAYSIFRNGLEAEALTSIVNSGRLDPETRREAARLLREIKEETV